MNSPPQGNTSRQSGIFPERFTYYSVGRYGVLPVQAPAVAFSSSFTGRRAIPESFCSCANLRMKGSLHPPGYALALSVHEHQQNALTLCGLRGHG